jgi:hypothetical protein
MGGAENARHQRGLRLQGDPAGVIGRERLSVRQTEAERGGRARALGLRPFCAFISKGKLYEVDSLSVYEPQQWVTIRTSTLGG